MDGCAAGVKQLVSHIMSVYVSFFKSHHGMGQNIQETKKASKMSDTDE